MRYKNLIQLYITNMCNSRCKTCNIWRYKEREDPPEELSVGQIRDIVLADKEADFVIGGGEAILHTKIHDILGMLHEEGVSYTLLSNAIRLRSLCGLVRKYNVPSVTVSCDGTKHDVVRGVAGNLHHICMFVRWARYNNIPFKLSYTYSAFNEKYFAQDMEFFKSLGINKIYFCLAQEMALLYSGDKSRVVAHNFEQILQYKDMLFNKDVRFIENMLNGTKPICDSQTSVFTVYSNGDVVRCQSFMSQPALFNIKDTSFSYWLKTANNVICPYDADCNLLCQRRYD